ncbi:MAG: hypothetical protein QM754_16340 [Tepidisphaeraceae bacterium]
MTTTDDWRLTIGYWPRAAAEGLRPHAAVGFGNDDPAEYRPHEFTFSNPPSREDFAAVVEQTPWMTTWQDDLLPLIARSQWPMISVGFKGASVDLTDADDRCVGRIEVWRRSRYCNDRRQFPELWTYPGSEVYRLLSRRIRDTERREEARTYLEKHRYQILERLFVANDSSTERALREVEQSDGARLPL